MPFAIQSDVETPLLLAFEKPSSEISDPQPTISAQLVAGWVCPECKCVLRAIAGPWSEGGPWWTYDHKRPSPRHSSYETTSVRPSSRKGMPRYRGAFGLDGGFLRRFDHAKPLAGNDHTENHSGCGLGVSMVVGIEPGIRNLPNIDDDTAEFLIDGIRTRGPSGKVVLIPDVLGLREPLIAMPRSVTEKWRIESGSFYNPEKRSAAWHALAPTLVGERTVAP